MNLMDPHLIDHLREQNSLLQRKIACQRHELARLYADNSALSSLMSRLFKENWDMKKKIEAASQPAPDVGGKLDENRKTP